MINLGLICATCNTFTGKGFDTAFLGGFSMVWLGAALLFFIIAFAKRWGFESIDMPFNLIMAEAGGLLIYFVAASLMCGYKIPFLIGILSGLAIGYFGSFFLGASE